MDTQTFIDDLRAYPVGSTHRVTFSWLNRQEAQDGEVGAEVPLSPKLIFCRTGREVSPGLFVAGCLAGEEGRLCVRDAQRDPMQAVCLIEEVAERLGVSRYTYTTAHHPGLDVYNVALQL